MRLVRGCPIRLLRVSLGVPQSGRSGRGERAAASSRERVASRSHHRRQAGTSRVLQTAKFTVKYLVWIEIAPFNIQLIHECPWGFQSRCYVRFSSRLHPTLGTFSL